MKAEQRAKMERFLADRKDKKMPTKLSPDNQVVNYTIENLEKSNEEFCHNFLKVAKTMETIGNSMQQTVRLLAQLIEQRPAQNIYLSCLTSSSFWYRQQMPGNVTYQGLEKNTNANTNVYKPVNENRTTYSLTNSIKESLIKNI